MSSKSTTKFTGKDKSRSASTDEELKTTPKKMKCGDAQTYDGYYPQSQWMGPWGPPPFYHHPMYMPPPPPADPYGYHGWGPSWNNPWTYSYQSQGEQQEHQQCPDYDDRRDGTDYDSLLVNADSIPNATGSLPCTPNSSGTAESDTSATVLIKPLAHSSPEEWKIGKNPTPKKTVVMPKKRTATSGMPNKKPADHMLERKQKVSMISAAAQYKDTTQSTPKKKNGASGASKKKSATPSKKSATPSKTAVSCSPKKTQSPKKAPITRAPGKKSAKKSLDKKLAKQSTVTNRRNPRSEESTGWIRTEILFTSIPSDEKKVYFQVI